MAVDAFLSHYASLELLHTGLSIELKQMFPFNQCCGAGFGSGFVRSVPYALGPPGSGSICTRDESGSRSGSGSFDHQAKIELADL
jgi:hypothetical protein